MQINACSVLLGAVDWPGGVAAARGSSAIFVFVEPRDSEEYRKGLLLLHAAAVLKAVPPLSLSSRGIRRSKGKVCRSVCERDFM